MSYNYDTSTTLLTSQLQRTLGLSLVWTALSKAFTLHWVGRPSTNPSYEGVRDYLNRLTVIHPGPYSCNCTIVRFVFCQLRHCVAPGHGDARDYRHRTRPTGS